MATTISFQPSSTSAGDWIDEVYASGPNGISASQFHQFLVDNNLPDTAFGKLSNTQTGFVTGDSIAKFFDSADKNHDNQLSAADLTQALGGTPSGTGSNGSLTVSLDHGQLSINNWGQGPGNSTNAGPTISFDNQGRVTINNVTPSNGSSGSGLTIGTDGHGGYTIGTSGSGSFGNSPFGNQNKITIAQGSNGQYTVNLGNGGGSGSNGFGGNGLSISPTANGYSIGFGNTANSAGSSYGSTNSPKLTIGQGPNGLTLGFSGTGSFGNSGFGASNISVGKGPNGLTIGFGNAANGAGPSNGSTNSPKLTVGQDANGLNDGCAGTGSLGNSGLGASNISIDQGPNGLTIGFGNTSSGVGPSYGSANSPSLTISQGPNGGVTLGLNNPGNQSFGPQTSGNGPTIQINGNGSVQLGSGYGSQGLPFGGMQNRLTPGEMVDRLLASQPAGTTSGNALTNGFTPQDFNRAFNTRVGEAASRFDSDGNGRLSVNEILSWYGQFDQNRDGLDWREARRAFA